MQKKVTITTSLVTLTDNGEERFNTSAEGCCVVADEGMYLRYAEPDNDGEAVWVLTADLVDLQRQGHITSRFTFIEGRLTDAPYTTPHGPIALKLYTHSAELDVDRERLLFKARYTVLAQGKAVADNHLRVEARFV